MKSTAATLLLLTIISLAWLAAPRAGAQATPTYPDARSPDLIALKLHADWCGSCKSMGDIFIDLTNKFDGEPVLFIKLDKTNKSNALQSEFLLAELGLGKLWNEYGKKTGMILLIDSRTGKVSKTLTADMDFKQMAGAIHKAISP